MSYQLECAIWEFTLKCNLNCSHCGSSAGKARPNELTTKECFKLCEELAELGCNEVALMGGEPFLRKDWLSVAQCIKDLGMNLNFVSNGIIIDQYIDKISRIEPQVIGISIDGMQKNHDIIRGEGTWNKSIKAIELLKEKGIQTTIITTISKINFGDLPLIKDFIYKKGINWQIQTAMPFGNFKKEQMITKEQFYEAAKFIANIRKKNAFDDLPVIGAHCFGYFSEIYPVSEWDGCWAGISSIGITSDGGIVGCLSMGNDRFIEGNVRKKSLIDIWENPDNFAYNRKFDESKLGSNCKDCEFGVKCKGGCNSVSYTLTKKFHNNPYCFRSIEKRISSVWI
ncbi:MAG: radical SAM protein [Promethearchaeota archaeon]